MRTKLLIISLFVSLLSFGQKLPITGLCLSNVVAVTGGTCLTEAFTNANPAYFDPAYAVSGNCLNDFRNYGPGACTRPGGLSYANFYYAISRNGVVSDFTGSFLEASQALYDYRNNMYPPTTIAGVRVNQLLAPISVGDSVYLGIGTGCAKEANGYYINEFAAYPENIYHVSGGIITEITMANINTVPSMYTAQDYTATGTSIDITGNQVLSDGGSSITEKGVAYGTSANPTISGSHTSDGTGTATYNSTMTGLSLNTLYYVRAYGTNSTGTGYGANVQMTSASITTPIVSTNNACFVDVDNALIEGTVNSDGGATVTERGFCYSTSNTNPTTADSVQPRGSGTGYFTWSPSGILPQNTTIYIRAYATNSEGTAYGDVYTIISDDLCN